MNSMNPKFSNSYTKDDRSPCNTVNENKLREFLNEYRTYIPISVRFAYDIYESNNYLIYGDIFDQYLRDQEGRLIIRSLFYFL